MLSLIQEEYFIIRLNQPSSDKGLDGNSGNVFRYLIKAWGGRGWCLERRGCSNYLGIILILFELVNMMKNRLFVMIIVRFFFNSFR